MAHRSNRRTFLQTTAALGMGYWVAGGVQAKESNSPNEKIRMASIGVDGKGQSDSSDAGHHGEMVAICDVDEKKLNAATAHFPQAKCFTDYRRMLEEMEKRIDAVTVSTPDHIHAVASIMAMKMGKHCFCQKPLTRTIYEARMMAQVAREMKVATQMGNQGTAKDGLRQAAALLRAGVIGKVSEVHVWTNRPIWAQGGPRPMERPVPASLKWDLWLGPAPKRPYAKGYHPFSWRGWWDFGSGALGDMACHTVNMPFMGLDLRNPTSVVAKTSGHNKDSYPKWSVITTEFAANATRGPVKLIWYDGGKRASPDLMEGHKMGGSGCLVIGEKAKIYSPDDYGANFQVFGNVKLPDEIKYPVSPGHFEEWVNAIRGGPAAMSNFPDYAAPLTETILLGNLAVWTADKGEGKKIEWDAENLKATNAPELEPLIRPEYHQGYSL